MEGPFVEERRIRFGDWDICLYRVPDELFWCRILHNGGMISCCYFSSINTANAFYSHTVKKLYLSYLRKLAANV
jgi:hypothetical protein